MIRKQVVKLLLESGQEQFLKSYDKLSYTEKEIVGRQILNLDFDLIASMKNSLRHPSTEGEEVFPASPSARAGSLEFKETGIRALQEMKCGAILVAGGQGSRLRSSLPKGFFKTTLIKQKSLFQLFAEKCIAASALAKTQLPIAIMTSFDNHAETCIFFAENHYFGLLPSQLSFFMQPSLPVLDLEGNLFLESSERIAFAPNGNGAVYTSFLEEGIYRRWKERGIECVTFSQIDNPLSDPFDPEFIGFHLSHGLDVGIKSIAKKKSDEKLGLIVSQKDGTIRIIEYSEISDRLKAEQNERGELLFSLANISTFSFSLSFMAEAAKTALPLHPSKKAVKVWNGVDAATIPETPNAFKFEQFVFDAFALTKKIETILYEREEVFSPLKNFEGEASIESVRESLLRSDQRAFERVTGRPLSDKERSEGFELSLDFHYPTEELCSKWKGKSLPPQKYISP